MAKLSASCVHANFSHLYLEFTLLKIFCPFECSLKLSKKCLLVFGNNSVKVSVSCDMFSEKTCYYSSIWKKLYENVSIAWYKLWKGVQYCLSGTLKMSVLLDEGLEKFVVLVNSNSLKMSVLLDIWKRVQYCLGVTPSKRQQCLI